MNLLPITKTMKRDRNPLNMEDIFITNVPLSPSSDLRREEDETEENINEGWPYRDEDFSFNEPLDNPFD